MQQPYALTGEKPEISVYLDNERGKELKKFHCPVCGRVVFEYYNEARIIMPGAMGEVGKSPIVVQCHGAISLYKDGIEINTRCKARFWIE